MFVFLLSVYVFILGAISPGTGLSCHNCVYLETYPPPNFYINLPHHLSCAPGRIPIDILSSDCSEILQSYNFDNKYTCVNISFDGQFGSVGDGELFIATIRTCIRTEEDKEFTSECNQNLLENIFGDITDDEVKERVSAFGFFLNAKVTNASVCTCNQDNCNVGDEVEDQSDSGGGRGPISASLIHWFSIVLLLRFTDYLII